MSKKRKKISLKGSKRLFTTTAKNVKPQNVYVGPMRGGIRM